MSVRDKPIRKQVELTPPAEVIEHAREQADGSGIEALEEHLLDAYLFEYEWVGVEDV